MGGYTYYVSYEEDIADFLTDGNTLNEMINLTHAIKMKIESLANTHPLKH